ncbi:MAG: hypothetical protein CMB56_005095 [Methanobacteriota archaeon]|nr:MAG: hypothetical protein CMB56_005095 [Euryarchaeota archaeon]|tara:strand:- start:536 stop:2713 length:2178 start_codon:yes stop_codon:yes gene_type:complete
MSEQDESGVDLPSSTLSHKELRMLCLDNDISISGKKSVLVERLLDAGLSWDDLGLESEDLVLEEDSESQLKSNEHTVPSEDLILEESSEIEEKIEEDDNLEDAIIDKISENDSELVFEAEIIEEAQTLVSSVKKETFEETLKNKLMNPKLVLTSVIVSILLLGSGWYFFSQPESFSPDKLRYGDSMDFSISSGFLQIEGDELVEIIATQLGAEDKMCGKIEIDYTGSGSVAVTEGDSIEIINQPDNSKLGVVQKQGPFGENWLTLEQKYEYDFDDIDIATNTPIANICSKTTLGNLNDNKAKINVDSWTEIRTQELLRADVGYEFEGGDLGTLSGTTVTYGFDQFGAILKDFLPGISLAFAPIELDKLLEGAFLGEGVSGEKWNWKWNVAGIDEVGGKETWKIYLENTEVSDRCFGSAKINLWATKDSPWPVKQYVDLKISNYEEDRTSCSKSWIEIVSDITTDIEIPQGRFNLQLMMLETSSTSGGELVDWKETYSNRPLPGQGYLNPTHDWKNTGVHMPDNSEIREFTIEDTINCMNQSGIVSELISALDVGGYVWRAINDVVENERTFWNFSWVDPSGISGWELIEIRKNQSGSDYCEIEDAGIFDSETISYNSNSISVTNSLSELESRVLDSVRYPELSGVNGIIAPNGELGNDVKLGYLVITPTENLNDILDLINREEGAVSFDMHRSYEEDGWDKSVELLIDATNGRIIGWSQTSKMNQ